MRQGRKLAQHVFYVGERFDTSIRNLKELQIIANIPVVYIDPSRVYKTLIGTLPKAFKHTANMRIPNKSSNSAPRFD